MVDFSRLFVVGGSNKLKDLKFAKLDQISYPITRNSESFKKFAFYFLFSTKLLIYVWCYWSDLGQVAINALKMYSWEKTFLEIIGLLWCRKCYNHYKYLDIYSTNGIKNVFLLSLLHHRFIIYFLCSFYKPYSKNSFEIFL